MAAGRLAAKHSILQASVGGVRAVCVEARAVQPCARGGHRGNPPTAGAHVGRCAVVILAPVGSEEKTKRTLKTLCKFTLAHKARC